MRSHGTHIDCFDRSTRTRRSANKLATQFLDKIQESAHRYLLEKPHWCTFTLCADILRNFQESRRFRVHFAIYWSPTTCTCILIVCLDCNFVVLEIILNLPNVIGLGGVFLLRFCLRIHKHWITHHQFEAHGCFGFENVKFGADFDDSRRTLVEHIFTRPTILTNWTT